MISDEKLNSLYSTVLKESQTGVTLNQLAEFTAKADANILVDPQVQHFKSETIPMLDDTKAAIQALFADTSITTNIFVFKEDLDEFCGKVSEIVITQASAKNSPGIKLRAVINLHRSLISEEIKKTCKFLSKVPQDQSPEIFDPNLGSSFEIIESFYFPALVKLLVFHGQHFRSSVLESELTKDPTELDQQTVDTLNQTMSHLLYSFKTILLTLANHQQTDSKLRIETLKLNLNLAIEDFLSTELYRNIQNSKLKNIVDQFTENLIGSIEILDIDILLNNTNWIDGEPNEPKGQELVEMIFNQKFIQTILLSEKFENLNEAASEQGTYPVTTAEAELLQDFYNKASRFELTKKEFQTMADQLNQTLHGGMPLRTVAFLKSYLEEQGLKTTRNSSSPSSTRTPTPPKPTNTNIPETIIIPVISAVPIESITSIVETDIEPIATTVNICPEAPVSVPPISTPRPASGSFQIENPDELSLDQWYEQFSNFTQDKTLPIDQKTSPEQRKASLIYTLITIAYQLIKETNRYSTASKQQLSQGLDKLRKLIKFDHKRYRLKYDDLTIETLSDFHFEITRLQPLIERKINNPEIIALNRSIENLNLQYLKLTQAIQTIEQQLNEGTLHNFQQLEIQKERTHRQDMIDRLESVLQANQEEITKIRKAKSQLMELDDFNYELDAELGVGLNNVNKLKKQSLELLKEAKQQLEQFESAIRDTEQVFTEQQIQKETQLKSHLTKLQSLQQQVDQRINLLQQELSQFFSTVPISQI